MVLHPEKGAMCVCVRVRGALTPQSGVLRVLVVGTLECELQPLDSDHVQLPLLGQAPSLLLPLLSPAALVLEVGVVHL